MPDAYRIRVYEKDLSGFITQESFETGAMVINSRKGPGDKPVLCQSETDVLLYFGAPNSTKWGSFEAISYCRQAPAYIISAIGDNAKFAGVDVKEISVVAFGTRAGRDKDTFVYTATDLHDPSFSVGTGNGITDSFGGSLTYTPVKAGSLILKVAGTDQGVTDAGGVISGSALDSGSIDYNTGAYTLDFAGVAGTAAILTTDIDLSAAKDLSTGATAGYQTISSVSLPFIGTTVPSIASNTYDLDIAIDGTPHALAFALLVTDTWNGIATKIETALQTATGSSETVVITGGKIKVTSATTGTSSTVSITAGTTGSGGGDLLTYIDTNIASMTTSIDTAVAGTYDDKYAKITIDGVTVTVNFGHDAATTKANIIAAINAAFTGTPATAPGNYVVLTGTVGDTTNGQITIAPPDSGTSAVDLIFNSAGDTAMVSTDAGQTASVSPTGSIPQNGQAITFDYLYTLDQSTTVSHTFYAYSQYDDTDYQLAVKIQWSTGTQYQLDLYEVLDSGNSLLETYTYSLTREKNAFGKSIYIFDVFNENPYIIPVVNSDYTGTTPNPTVATVAFTGGDRGDDPASSDFDTAWDIFQSINKYRIKTFMDIYGTHATKLQSLMETYQPYAFGITMVPIGNSVSAASTFRSSLGIDYDNLALYWNWAKIKDPYNDSYAWISQIGKIGVKYAQMEDVFDGLAPAGIDENKHGGQLSGFQVVEMEYDLSETDKQTLNEAQINPIYFDDQYGTIIDGDRTLQVSNSDTSFIGTRRLYNLIIDNIVRQILRKQVFKLNDELHRLQAYSLTTNYLNPIISAGLFREIAVVCDATNNTEEVLDQRKFILDVFVKITPTSEFVTLRFTRLSQTQVLAEFLPSA